MTSRQSSENFPQAEQPHFEMFPTLRFPISSAYRKGFHNWKIKSENHFSIIFMFKKTLEEKDNSTFAIWANSYGHSIHLIHAGLETGIW